MSNEEVAAFGTVIANNVTSMDVCLASKVWTETVVYAKSCACGSLRLVPRPVIMINGVGLLFTLDASSIFAARCFFRWSSSF